MLSKFCTILQPFNCYSSKTGCFPEKTEVLLVRNPLDWLEGHLSRVDGFTLPLRYRVHDFGVILDPVLSLEHQIMAMVRSAFV